MHIFSGEFKRRALKTPKGAATRPTTGMVRQAVFNIVQHSIEDSRFLDLFAGSGAMGLEALSRGAKSAVFVENDKYAAQCIEENIKSLDVSKRVRLLRKDCLKAIKSLSESGDSFDFIYADPPYLETFKEGLLSEEVLRMIGSSALLKENGLFIIEEDRKAGLDRIEFKGLSLIETRPFGKSVLYLFKKC